MNKVLVAWSLACITVCAPAKEAVEMAEDPALEARVMHIAEELRCLVCQNETIAASSADLAVDLRNQIRSKLHQGQSEQQILDFMVERYGDFVRYRPAFKPVTLLLWVGPFVLLAVAFLTLRRSIAQRGHRAVKHELSPAEAQRVRDLLDNTVDER